MRALPNSGLLPHNTAVAAAKAPPQAPGLATEKMRIVGKAAVDALDDSVKPKLSHAQLPSAMLTTGAVTNEVSNDRKAYTYMLLTGTRNVGLSRLHLLRRAPKLKWRRHSGKTIGAFPEYN
eukprot:2311534-Amphidinium_carterae.1